MNPFRHAAVAAAVVSLGLPAFAGAHPSVYTDQSRAVAQGDTAPIAPGDLVLIDRHVVTNHGYTYVLRESNGASDKGLLDYSRVPGAYRNQPGFEPGPAGSRTRLLSEGDSAAQPHATCRGVAALAAEEAILAWQGSDPFYNYVPFQAASAGLEDDPSKWIPVVKARTGVDLESVTNFAQACQNLGGTYTPADAIATTTASLTAGTVELATAPLKAEIDSLTAQVAAANAATASATGERDAALTRATGAEGASAALSRQLTDAQAALARMGAPKSRDLRISLAKGAAASGARATVTGNPGQGVLVRLMVSKAVAREHGLASRVLVTRTTILGTDGATVLNLRPERAARRAFARHGGHSHPVTAHVVGLGLAASTSGTLAR